MNESAGFILAKGDQFNSYESLAEAVSKWEQTNFVQLYKRHTRTINSAAKRSSIQEFNSNLQYGEIDYSCIHGEKKAASHCTGKRQNLKLVKFNKYEPNLKKISHWLFLVLKI